MSVASMESSSNIGSHRGRGHRPSDLGLALLTDELSRLGVLSVVVDAHVPVPGSSRWTRRCCVSAVGSVRTG